MSCSVGALETLGRLITPSWNYLHLPKIGVPRRQLLRPGQTVRGYGVSGRIYIKEDTDRRPAPSTGMGADGVTLSLRIIGLADSNHLPS